MPDVDETALKNAIEASLVGVAILDTDGEYVYVNDAHVDIYGYESEDAFHGKSWEMCYDKDQLARFDGVFDTLEAEGEWRGELHGVKADGTRFPQELSLSTLPDGGIVSVVRDVTTYRQHERQLEALNEATRRLMSARDRDAVAETVVEIAESVLDETLLALWFAAESAERLDPTASSAAADAVSGAPDARIRPIEPDTREWTVYASGEPWFTDSYRDLPSSERSNPDTPLGSTAVLPLGEHGIMSAARMAVDPFSEPERDVLRVLALNATAALDRAERETELARKNERLDEFTSVVSHDLRNPLSLIRGHTELAMETGETDALEEVLAAADRMDRLIDDLLTLARQGDLIGETEPVSVDGVTERAWEAVQTGDAALTVDAGSAAVEADPERLRELLENLFRNSVEHGAEAEDSTDAAVTVHVTVDPAAEQFVVADDGIGIPPDERENVLNHGYSTAADGTGFGLAIVDRIADGHDWTVSIDESETGGARFCFENVTIRE